MVLALVLDHRDEYLSGAARPAGERVQVNTVRLSSLPVHVAIGLVIPPSLQRSET